MLPFLLVPTPLQLALAVLPIDNKVQAVTVPVAVLVVIPLLVLYTLVMVVEVAVIFHIQVVPLLFLV